MNGPNVGKYTIHRAYGYVANFKFMWCLFIATLGTTVQRPPMMGLPSRHSPYISSDIVYAVMLHGNMYMYICIVCKYMVQCVHVQIYICIYVYI